MYVTNHISQLFFIDLFSRHNSMTDHTVILLISPVSLAKMFFVAVNERKYMNRAWIPTTSGTKWGWGRHSDEIHIEQKKNNAWDIRNE